MMARMLSHATARAVILTIAVLQSAPVRSAEQDTADAREIIRASIAFVDQSSGWSHLLQSRALWEFGTWSQANPRADRAATYEAAQEIIRRYQLADVQKFEIVLGLSPYFPDSKTRADITSADIANANVKLESELATGKISTAQAVFEIERLKNWEAVLDRRNKPATVRPPHIPGAPPPKK